MNSPASSPLLSVDHSQSNCGARLAQFSLAAYLVGILGTAIYMVVTGWQTATLLANSAVLALVTVFGAFGYGAFLLGMLLLAWGFVRLDAETGKGELVERLS